MFAWPSTADDAKHSETAASQSRACLFALIIFNLLTKP